MVSQTPDDVHGFWLLAAFSRSRIRLNDLSVGQILHSVLGGRPPLFVAVQVEENNFKFTVASKAVGLIVYGLQFFASHSLKVHFHLWNENGLNFARSSSLSDCGPHFDWESVKLRKLRNKSLLHRSNVCFDAFLRISRLLRMLMLLLSLSPDLQFSPAALESIMPLRFVDPTPFHASWLQSCPDRS